MKTKQRILAILLLAFVLAGSFLTPVCAQAEKALPAVGDIVSGFKVLEVRPMDVLGAQAVVFEHEKSGATLLYLQTDDINRSFNIAFKTPALDDTGKAHVFEHITICGSTKYASPNLFFPFYNQTYNTFVNALTYHSMTSYPVASLSEDQLELMMDFYLSGVFSPILYSEPRMVNREAWRYELADKDADPTLTGTVYSEMKGANSIANVAYINTLETLYTGSAVAHESGGVPEAIRTLTYDDLIAFHKTYYHPSNALITLYGDLDYERFLRFIDENYLSGFDRREIDVEKGVIEPLTETVEARFDYPVEADSPAENASYANYAFAANGADASDVLGLEILASVLNSESSALMRAARERLPGVSVGVYINVDSPTPYLAVQASGCNEADGETLRALTDEAIAQIAQDGLDAQAVGAVLANLKIRLLNAAEDVDLGVNASLELSLAWATLDTLDYYEIYSATLEKTDAASLQGLVKTYLLENPHRALALTVPKPGLAEQNDAALAAELSEMKAGMTDEEIAAMIEETAAFTEWTTAAPDPQYMEALQAVSVATLPEEVRHYEIAEETLDGGVRSLTARADVAGLGKTQIELDASNLPVEQLRDVALYANLLGKLDTSAHSKEELSTLISRYLNSFGASLNANYHKDGGYLYGFDLSWINLMNEYDEALSLAREIAFDTQFTDVQAVKALITRSKTSLKNSLDSSPLGYQFNRALAVFRDDSAFQAHLSGPGMYAYLAEMEQLADSNPEELTRRLDAAREAMRNQFGACVLFAGSEDSIAAYKKSIGSFFEGLPNAARPATDYGTLRPENKNVALVIDSAVQFNMIAGQSNDTYTGKTRAVMALIDDLYMIPNLRNAMGAYGAYNSIGRLSTLLYTYRDPSLTEAYEVFAALPEYLETLEARQSDIDRYILSAYSGLARPMGALSGAMNALAQSLRGFTEADTLQEMRELKQTTLDDVRAAAAKFRDLNENGVKVTSGGAAALQACPELFDTYIGIGTEE